MKKLLKNQKGVIALISVLILLGVGTLGIGMVITSQLSSSSANNYRNKIQTYSAADGMMTLLAQDLLDFNDNKYFGTAGPLDSIGASTDVGSCGSVGSYVYNGGAQREIGSGGDIQGTADNMRFAYGTLTGNCNLIVKVVSMTNPNTWAKAGIMIRQSLNANSRNVCAVTTPIKHNGINFQSRETDGGNTNWKNDSSTTPFPVWLGLSRSGNIFTVTYSKDSSTWTTINKDTITMTDPVYAGLVVTSHADPKLDTAFFSSLTGMSFRSFTDTSKVGKDSIPVIYNLVQLGTNLFNMSTYSYVLKGTTQGRNYETHLTQMLSRESKGAWLQTAHDSALIPVTLYDFRADNSCPEFQVLGKEIKNMLQDNLSADRKPVAKTTSSSFRSCILAPFSTSTYCFGGDWYTISKAKRDTEFITMNYQKNCITNCLSSNPPGSNGWWFNDSMNTWFRPWGDAGIPGAYSFDPLSGKWSGLKQRPKYSSSTHSFSDTVYNEWVPLNWDSTQQFANIVMYDTLKFRQKKTGDTTIFTFGDSSWIYKQDSIWFVKGCNCADTISYLGGLIKMPQSFALNEYKFMPLKNRGFGYDAAMFFPKGYNSCVDKCNFSFTMEIHRKFTYKPNQTFFFRGDDDVWVYINNQRVIDLGGSHTVDTQTVVLDNIIPALVSGQQYWFDLFYCERDVNSSNIYISTNMLMFIPPQPLKRNWKRDYGNLD